MARKKPSPVKVTATGHLTLQINGHTLTGTETDGAWSYECPSFPDLAGPVPAGKSYTDIVGEFTTRCLAGAVQVKQLTQRSNRK
jgi:hypothetical protein